MYLARSRMRQSAIRLQQDNPTRSLKLTEKTSRSIIDRKRCLQGGTDIYVFDRAAILLVQSWLCCPSAERIIEEEGGGISVASQIGASPDEHAA